MRTPEVIPAKTITRLFTKMTDIYVDVLLRAPEPDTLDISSPERLKEAELRAEILYTEIVNTAEIREALDILDQLPEHLVYHTKEHTLDVIRETVLFGIVGNAHPDLIRQQALSAAWHDAGFVQEEFNEKSEDEDTESVAIRLFESSEAFKNLPKKFTSEVRANIWDTRVARENGSLYIRMKESHYGYVLDADVSNFGRDDFFEKMGLVARELKLDLGDPTVQKKFYGDVLGLLTNHSWQTKAARLLREEQKQENLKKLEEMYEALPA